MCNSWVYSFNRYNWSVNLEHFKYKTNYPGYFNRVIQPNDIKSFENSFRNSIISGEPIEIVGEVCYWKNFGNHKVRDRITNNLLVHLLNQDNWKSFTRAIKNLSQNPSFENFLIFKDACNQKNGFAVPITFLSFFNPDNYPIVDRHIANWWNECKDDYGCNDSPKFKQRNDGLLIANEDNWKVYINWKSFCYDIANKLKIYCDLIWRIRDVEIAVWVAQQNGLVLNKLYKK